MPCSVGQVKICLSVCLLSPPQKPLSCAALAVRLVVRRHSYREPLRRESLSVTGSEDSSYLSVYEIRSMLSTVDTHKIGYLGGLPFSQRIDQSKQVV